MFLVEIAEVSEEFFDGIVEWGESVGTERHCGEDNGD